MKRGELKPNIVKLHAIFRVIQAYPDGIWFRQLVRESKLSISTVHHYLKAYFEPFVENLGYKTENKFLGIRMIRLKKDVTITDIVNYHRIKERIKGS